MKKILSFILILTLALSFTAFASGFECISTSIADGASAVYAYEGTITFTFSEEVKYDSITSTSITKNSVSLANTDFFVELNGTDSKKVEVTINTLEYGATYVIDYSAYTNNSDALVLNDPATLTFTVEDEPEVLVSQPTLLAGIETGTITNPPNVTTGSLSGWMIDVENNASSDKEITVVCALYDANGLLKKIVTSSKTVLAGTTDSIGIGTVIPATTDTGVAYTGGKSGVKIFVWDSMENKCPYVAGFPYDILAPTP